MLPAMPVGAVKAILLVLPKRIMIFFNTVNKNDFPDPAAPNRNNE